MIKLSPKDKNISWQLVVSRKFSPFCDYIFSTATGFGSGFKVVLGYKHSYRRIYVNGDLFYCKEDILREKEKQLEQLQNDISLAAQRTIQAEKEGKSLMKLASSIRDKNFDKLTTQQIEDLLSRFLDSFYRFITFLLMPLTVESYLEGKLDSYLAQKYKENKNRIKTTKAAILTPAKDNLQVKEQLSILKLAEKFKKEGRVSKNFKEGIKKHINKFGTLGFRYGVGDIWKIEDIMERIKSLSRDNPREQYNQLIQTKKQNQRQFEKIIKELRPDKYIKEIIRVIREYIFLRTYRTNILSSSIGVIKPFLEKIAKRLRVDFGTLNYMIPPEILESLKLQNIPKKFLAEVKKREKGFGSIFINGQYRIFTGKEMGEVVSKFNLRTKISKQDIIRGVIANQGKAKGLARILYFPEDNKKVKKGDILVTSMTTPNFISAMERAGAFVTDEGGILCHAAIVSREMDKPCIIGTKIATKVFKDGDLVEVDANKGVVRKLE